MVSTDLAMCPSDGISIRECFVNLSNSPVHGSFLNHSAGDIDIISDNELNGCLGYDLYNA